MWAPRSSQEIALGRVADAAAHAAWGEIDQLLDDRGIRALPERGIQIDHGDLADQAETPRERARIARIERLGLAADQLDRLAALQVDRGDDHGRTITLASWQSFIPQSSALVAVVPMLEPARGGLSCELVRLRPGAARVKWSRIGAIN